MNPAVLAMEATEGELAFHVDWNAKVCQPSEMGVFAANAIRYMAREVVDIGDRDVECESDKLRP